MIKELFSAEQWIAWIGATVAAAVMLSAYAFTNFETKEESKEKRESIEKRLDRIDDKLDRVIEAMQFRPK